MSKIRPLQDRILVRRLEEAEVSKGGIIIPNSAKEKPAEGDVVAIGSGRKTVDGDNIPLDVKTGDKIIFNKHAGSVVTLEDEEFLILYEHDILAVVE